MGRPALIMDLGTKTLGPGVSEITIPFGQHYDYLPAVVLTSATVQEGGSVNAYVSEVCTTSFKLHVSDEGNYVDVCWRAVLDRQKGPQGKGDSPQFDKPAFYNLSVSFTDNSGNVYSQATADKLVLWLQMTETQPTNKVAPYINAYYKGSVSAGNLQVLLDDVYLDNPAPKRLTATLDDVANKNIFVPGNSILSHNTLPSGVEANVAGTDKAFSISLWVKPNNSASTDDYNYLFGKDKTETAGSIDKEYYAYIYLGGDPEIRVSLVGGPGDPAASRTMDVRGAVIPAADIEDKWTHIVITYIGGTVTHTSAWVESALKIYVNGSYSDPQSHTVSGAYESMLPDHSYNMPLYIGGNWNNSQEFTGDMAEFAMWQDHALAATEVMAVYSGSIGRSYGA